MHREEWILVLWTARFSEKDDLVRTGYMNLEPEAPAKMLDETYRELPDIADYSMAADPTNNTMIKMIEKSRDQFNRLLTARMVV